MTPNVGRGIWAVFIEAHSIPKDVTDDIAVYKYSPSLTLQAMRGKVDRIAQPATYDSFQSFVRRMARDGLAPELQSVKEELRQGKRVLTSGTINPNTARGQKPEFAAPVKPCPKVYRRRCIRNSSLPTSMSLRPPELRL